MFVDEARFVVSNTGDRGYALDPDDRIEDQVPRSFPAKLVKLLYARYRKNGEPVTLLSCELTSRNGDSLRRIAVEVAGGWGFEADFLDWLSGQCLWANSLVDRIVSEPLDPVGAIAEPYALWAIEAQPGLELPCLHPDVKLVDDLAPYERLKLFILNLGHTYLAERWLVDGRDRRETVREALDGPELREQLRYVYEREVVPIFAAIGMEKEATLYRNTVMDRFRNPFLRHKYFPAEQGNRPAETGS